MIKDITLGQYYSTDSLLHRLDSRVKIRFTIAYIILLLLDRSLILFSVLTMTFLFCVVLAKVPFKHIIKGTKSIIFFVLICSMLNMFTTTGDVLVHVIGLSVTGQGLVKSGFIFWRMMLMIFTSSIIMYTTTPTELTDGLEKCFHLSKNLALGITIALRFIPVLFEELDRIMKAQEARGANFRTGGPINRIKSLKTVISPLFQNAIDKATNLAEAMDARCYVGGKGRTKLKPLKYDIIDFVAYIILLTLIIGCIWIAIVW